MIHYKKHLLHIEQKAKNLCKMNTEIKVFNFGSVPYFLTFIFEKTLIFIFQGQLFTTLFYKNGQGGDFSKTLLNYFGKNLLQYANDMLE